MVGKAVAIPEKLKADKNKEMKTETSMNQNLLSRLLLLAGLSDISCSDMSSS